jgi:dolichol-phosphate mannosyltransferase
MSNGYARAVTRLPVRDITTGFRCFRRQALEALDLGELKANGYGFLIEVAYRMWRSGGRLIEIPITFYGRQEGTSKMSRRMILEAAILVWRLRLSSVVTLKFLYSHARPEPVEGRVIWASTHSARTVYC